jgi:hypothetical protein
MNPSMQENDTNTVAATSKVKAFIGKLDLWVRKLGQKCLNMFSCLKDFVEESSMEASDTIKNHLVTLQSRLSKYFPEAESDKCIAKYQVNSVRTCAGREA